MVLLLFAVLFAYKAAEFQALGFHNIDLRESEQSESGRHGLFRFGLGSFHG